jgi:hypothetical protein
MRVGGAVPYDVCMHVTWENITCVTGVHRFNIQEWIKTVHACGGNVQARKSSGAAGSARHFDTFARFLAGGSA